MSITKNIIIGVVIVITLTLLSLYYYFNKTEVNCAIGVLRHNPTLYNMDFDQGGIVLTQNSQYVNCTWHTQGSVGRSYYDLWQSALNHTEKFYNFKR